MTRQKICKRMCSTSFCLLLSTALAPIPPATAQPSSAPQAVQPADRTYFERLVRKIEPDVVGKPDRLPIYLEFFKREMINDSRLFAIDVKAKAGDDGCIQLTGFVEFDENRDDLVNFVRVLGFDRLEDHIEVLPSDELGEKRFGFIVASHSLSYGQPAKKEVVTDCLLGEPVYLLKEAEAGFFLCHSVEGYLGYVHGQDIHRVNAETFLRYQSGTRVSVLADHETPDGPLLPVGARLKMLRQDRQQMVVALPAGDEAVLPANLCETVDDRPSPRVERVIENGHRLLGTEYLWGGKSSAGIDCSGLVQVSFAAEGIHLPRDSNQQVYLGRLTATRWFRAGMRRGDTLYFLGRHGKIIHTAIYLGEGKYLESAGPGVRITSFNPADDKFDARRSRHFAFAKRLLE